MQFNPLAPVSSRQLLDVAPAHTLPAAGFLRIWQIVGKPATKSSPAVPAIFPVCRSTWYSGVKTGKYPQSVKLGDRISAWRVEDVLALIRQPS